MTALGALAPVARPWMATMLAMIISPTAMSQWDVVPTIASPITMLATWQEPT